MVYLFGMFDQTLGWLKKRAYVDVDLLCETTKKIVLINKKTLKITMFIMNYKTFYIFLDT